MKLFCIKKRFGNCQNCHCNRGVTLTGVNVSGDACIRVYCDSDSAWGFSNLCGAGTWFNKEFEKESFSSWTGCDHPHRDFRCTCMSDRDFTMQSPRTHLITGAVSCVLRGGNPQCLYQRQRQFGLVMAKSEFRFESSIDLRFCLQLLFILIHVFLSG